MLFTSMSLRSAIWRRGNFEFNYHLYDICVKQSSPHLVRQNDNLTVNYLLLPVVITLNYVPLLLWKFVG